MVNSDDVMLASIFQFLIECSFIVEAVDATLRKLELFDGFILIECSYTFEMRSSSIVSHTITMLNVMCQAAAVLKSCL
jgi:hypothetical protein